MSRPYAGIAGLGLLSALCLTAAPGRCHDLGVVRIELHAMGAARYVIEAKLPPSLEPTAPSLPNRCAILGAPRVDTRAAATTVVRWEFRCHGAPLGRNDSLSFPWPREGVFFALHRPGFETVGHFIEGEIGRPVEIDLGRLGTNADSLVGTIRRYLSLGVEHILLGWDHLAFVLALCLVARGWRLAQLVTAFTIGHSLTLAAAVLGLARLPEPVVEACIALSIAFVAREALMSDRSGDPRIRHGAGLVAAFGLLHGLGFASALVESSMPRSELFTGLVACNVGVELGQLAFVLAVTIVAATVRTWRIGTWARPATAFGLGTLGMYWTFERVRLFLVC